MRKKKNTKIISDDILIENREFLSFNSSRVVECCGCGEIINRMSKDPYQYCSKDCEDVIDHEICVNCGERDVIVGDDADVCNFCGYKYE